MCISPSLVQNTQPSPQLAPPPKKKNNREIGHKLFRAEQGSVFSYMKCNFRTSVPDADTQAMGDMSFHLLPFFTASVRRSDPSQLSVDYLADLLCAFFFYHFSNELYFILFFSISGDSVLLLSIFLLPEVKAFKISHHQQ